MRPRIFRQTRFSQKFFLRIWAAFHIAVALSFAISAALSSKSRPFSISADFFSLVPNDAKNRAVSAAVEFLSKAASENVLILAADKNFDRAKSCAEALCAELSSSGFFYSAECAADGDFGEISDYLKSLRWNFLDSNSACLINSEGGSQSFCEDALAKAYGAFCILPLDCLERDPFMLAEREAEGLLERLQAFGGAAFPKDGVLAAEQEGEFFVLVRATLAKKGGSMTSKENGIAEIRKACAALEGGGTRFVFSGVPFHVEESAKSAQKEIFAIMLISTLALSALLIFTFRSPVPIFLSMLSVFASLAAAFLAALAAFRQIHAVSLLFGASVIGCGIDYSLHYFLHWSFNPALKSGAEIRSRIFGGLFMAILSSMVSFAFLSLATFDILRQISVFCAAGLASAFLTAVSIFPLVPPPKKKREIKFLRFKIGEKTKAAAKICVVAAFAASLFFGGKSAIKNDVSRLYAPSKALAESESEAARILGYGKAADFVICGEDCEAALRREEDFRKLLDEKGVPYMCSSLLIPSRRSQEESRAACEKLFPHLRGQLEALGFDGSLASSVLADFSESASNFASIEFAPVFVRALLSRFWIGEKDGGFHLILSAFSGGDGLRDLAEESDGVFFIDKAEGVNKSLDDLTAAMIRAMALAFAAIFAVLKAKYSWRDAAKIASTPIFASMAIFLALRAAGLSAEFFSASGAMLAFGLGIDYVIYAVENARSKSPTRLEGRAVLLSFLTTEMSFGILAASSFHPVKLLGLSIFAGIFAAFFFSIESA